MVPKEETLLIVYCGYRDWALNSFVELKKAFEFPGGKVQLQLVTSQDNLLSLFEHGIRPDLVLCAGWSWIIPKTELKLSRFFGIHPSDLPLYAGGTPLQHQIIDGLTATKVSLFELNSEIDSGPIVNKTPLSLDGSLEKILSELSKKTTFLFSRLIEAFPNVSYIQSSSAGHSQLKKKRLQPTSGQITTEKLGQMTVKELYNFVRCREYPYPHAYFQDHTGKLEIERVVFIDSE